MKLAIVHDWLTGMAGGEQVVLALHEMYPEAPIYTSLYRPDKLPQFAKAKVIASHLQGMPRLKDHHQVAIPLMPLAFEKFDLTEFDTIVSSGSLAKGVLTQVHQRHLNYCHTPMRYAWNLGGDNRGEGWLRSQVAHRLRLWDAVSSMRPDQYIANSRTVAERIAKIYRRDAVIVHPPVNTDRFQPSGQDPGDYFVSVCRLISYKRLDVIIEAAKMTRQRLKIAGTGPDEAALKQLASGAPWIEFLGRVPDSQLQDLYGGARAFLFAAEEDFGIVPVEAMSAGRPVIAYGRGGATETVAEGVSGVLFPEQTAASLAAVLETFDPYKWDSQAIRRWACTFDTDVFKTRMRALIEA